LKKKDAISTLDLPDQHRKINLISQPGVNYHLNSQMRIQFPARIIVVGASGSRKTSTLIGLLERVNIWKRLWLFAKNSEEPLYKSLAENWMKLGGELVVSEDLKELPDITDLARIAKHFSSSMT